jgi:hypothetical protein
MKFLKYSGIDLLKEKISSLSNGNGIMIVKNFNYSDGSSIFSFYNNLKKGISHKKLRKRIK